MTNFKTLFFTKNFKQLLSYLLLSVFVISCTEKKKPEENVSPKKDNTTTLFKSNTVTELDNNIRSIINNQIHIFGRSTDISISKNFCENSR